MTPSRCADCRERPCPACRLLESLRAEPVAAPSGFADRAFVAVVRDRRQRLRQRWAGRVGVAAALMVAVGLTADRLRPGPRIELVEVTPVAPPPVTPADPLGDVRDALASVTQRAGEAALAPTRNLLAGMTETVEVPTPPVEVAVPSASVAMLDPLTDTTLRAVSFFLKDVRQLAAADPEATR